jgi:hypothetical protein
MRLPKARDMANTPPTLQVPDKTVKAVWFQFLGIVWNLSKFNAQVVEENKWSFLSPKWNGCKIPDQGS